MSSNGNHRVSIDISDRSGGGCGGGDVPIDITNADDFDRQLLHKAVADAGRWAVGAIMVEVWVMNSANTKLFRPKVGWWIDPVVLSDTDELTRFTDEKHQEYLEALPLCPGVGIPGILWNEAHHHDGNRGHSQFKSSRKVAWRDIEYLQKDDDQPPNERLEGLVDAGLGWAAGIPFSIGGKAGIVVYMCRKNVDLKKVKHPLNVKYLISASDLIGSAWSLRSPRLQLVEMRRKEHDAVLRKVRNAILFCIRLKSSPHKSASQKQLATIGASTVKPEEPQEAEDADSSDLLKRSVGFLHQKTSEVITKSVHGGKAQAPPPKNTREALFSATGAVLTMLIVTQLSVHFINQYSPDWTIVVGPFGALATLHYGLTTAPASQPRNCLVSVLIAMTIAISLTYSELEPYLRQSIALGLTVFVTAKLGVIHPPSGAAAVIFASGGQDWKNMGAFLVGYIVIILCSTVFNNLNTKRQYPMYWGFQPLIDLLESKQDKVTEKEETEIVFVKSNSPSPGKPPI